MQQGKTQDNIDARRTAKQEELTNAANRLQDLFNFHESELVPIDLDEARDIAETQHEISKVAWFFLGRLITVGLLDVPDLTKPESISNLRFVMEELEYCVAATEF